jgi:hypothetical protein
VSYGHPSCYISLGPASRQLRLASPHARVTAHLAPNRKLYTARVGIASSQMWDTQRKYCRRFGGPPSVQMACTQQNINTHGKCSSASRTNSVLIRINCWQSLRQQWGPILFVQCDDNTENSQAETRFTFTLARLYSQLDRTSLTRKRNALHCIVSVLAVSPRFTSTAHLYVHRLI